MITLLYIIFYYFVKRKMCHFYMKQMCSPFQEEEVAMTKAISGWQYDNYSPVLTTPPTGLRWYSSSEYFLPSILLWWFIYRAVETTNTIWSTFFGIKADIGGESSLQTLLPTPSVTLIGITWCGWHHCDVGIIKPVLLSRAPPLVRFRKGRCLVLATFCFSFLFFFFFLHCSGSQVELQDRGNEAEGSGPSALFLCQMLLIFKPPSLVFYLWSHPQVLHIWLVKNDL